MSIKAIYNLLTNIHDKTVAVLTTGALTDNYNSTQYYLIEIESTGVTAGNGINIYIEPLSTSYYYKFFFETGAAGFHVTTLRKNPTVATTGTAVAISRLNQYSASTEHFVVSSNITFSATGDSLYYTRTGTTANANNEWIREWGTINNDQPWILSSTAKYMIRCVNLSGVTIPETIRAEFYEVPV